MLPLDLLESLPFDVPPDFPPSLSAALPAEPGVTWFIVGVVGAAVALLTLRKARRLLVVVAAGVAGTIWALSSGSLPTLW